MGNITSCKHEKAASRYNFIFFVQATEIAVITTLGAAGSSAYIASWQDEHSEATAYKIASFPWHAKTKYRTAIYRAHRKRNAAKIVNQSIFNFWKYNDMANIVVHNVNLICDNGNSKT